MSGTTLDPTIPLHAGQGVAQPIAPLDLYGKFAGVQNALTQNRAMEAGIKQTETGTAGMQQAQALQRLGAIGDVVGGILSAHPDGVPSSAVTAGAVQLLTAGIVPQNEIGQIIQSIPMGDDRDSVTKRTDMLKQFRFQGLAVQQQIERTRGGFATMANGQQNQPGLLNEQGFRPTGAPTAVYPSRADLAGRVQVGTNPDGSPISGPLANVTPENLAGPAAGGLGDGRYPTVPPALRAPAAGSAAPAAPRVPNAGNVTTGIGNAAAAAQSGTGAASAAAFNAISQAGTHARSQDAILANMQNEAAQFATGPGQDRVKLLQSALVTWAPKIASVFGVDPKTVAANESFDKLAAQIADAQGAGSDARLSVTQQANPSSHLTPAGIDMILRQLRGNADYLKARQALGESYPNKADAQGFEAKVGANLDPRVFQFNRLNAEQRGTFFSSIKDRADKDAFKRAFKWATDQGLLGGSVAGQ